MSPQSTVATTQLLTDQDLYLFNEGSNYRMYEKMGAHLVTHEWRGRRRLQRVGSECALCLRRGQLQ